MPLSYSQSIEAADTEIRKLRAVMSVFYSDKQLVFGLGKAGQGFASYHAVLNGITYGRITYKDGTLYSIKYYKPDGYEFDAADPGEFLFLRIQSFYATGHIPSDVELSLMVEAARRRVAKELEVARLYREAHPARNRRKALKGRNIRYIIRDALRQFTTFTSAIASIMQVSCSAQ